MEGMEFVNQCPHVDKYIMQFLIFLYSWRQERHSVSGYTLLRDFYGPLAFISEWGLLSFTPNF